MRDTDRKYVYKKLPDDIFEVIVPRIAVLDDFELEFYGGRMEVVNNRLVRPDPMQPHRCGLNLDKIIDVYNNGHFVKIVNDSDLKKIFNILEDYVDDKFDYNTFSLTAKRYEEPRLKAIDSFLNEIMDLNTKELLPDMINHVNGFSLGINPMNIKVEPTPLVTMSDKQDSGYTGSNFGRLTQKYLNGNNKMYDNVYDNIPNINFDNFGRKNNF